MQNRQQQTINRCTCWGVTRIVLEVKHCPSTAAIVRAECDKMVQYAMDHTDLSRFGKIHFSLAEFTAKVPTGE